MNEGIVVRRQRKRPAKRCQHRWVIETPHGATSRGICKLCGNAKRFPNAAEDAFWAAGRANLRGLVGRRGVAGPTKITLDDGVDVEI